MDKQTLSEIADNFAKVADQWRDGDDILTSAEWKRGYVEALDSVVGYTRALSASSAGGWEKIESAPRDGTRIWAYFPYAKRLVRESCFAVSWRENVYERGDPNWTLDDGNSANFTYDPPSHWQPLPSPPPAPVSGEEG